MRPTLAWLSLSGLPDSRGCDRSDGTLSKHVRSAWCWVLVAVILRVCVACCATPVPDFNGTRSIHTSNAVFLHCSRPQARSGSTGDNGWEIGFASSGSPRPMGKWTAKLCPVGAYVSLGTQFCGCTSKYTATPSHSLHLRHASQRTHRHHATKSQHHAHRTATACVGNHP